MITLTFNSKRGFVVISVKGQPSLGEYLQSSRELATHPNYRADLHRICDFSQIDDLSVSAKDIITFADNVRENVPTDKSAKVALVASGERDIHMMELFAEQFDPSQLRVFPEGRDAMAWILWGEPLVRQGLPVDEIRAHRIIGEFSGLDILRLQEKWLKDPDFDSTTPVLWDLRFGIPIGNSEDIPTLVHGFIERSKQARPDGIASIVTSDSELMQTLSEAYSESLAAGRMFITEDYEDAQAWLLKDPL